MMNYKLQNKLFKQYNQNKEFILNAMELKNRNLMHIQKIYNS